MFTKQQKIKQMEEGQELLKQSRGLIFVDFTGASVEDFKILRKTLREFGAKLKVLKKKLFRIVFEKEKINFNPEQFESQLGVIFANKEIDELAAPIYKFAKDLERRAGPKKQGASAVSGFKILGAFDLSAKNFHEAETVIKLGQLPTREILLAQLVGVLSAPLRMLAYIIQERSKKVA